MLEKLKSLSMGAKVGIASGAVLLAAAGVGLGITQPWNNQEETLPPEPPLDMASLRIRGLEHRSGKILGIAHTLCESSQTPRILWCAWKPECQQLA